MPLGSAPLLGDQSRGLQIPSLDDTSDVLMDCSRGRALGPDVLPIEVVQIGGLPAARLMQGLVVASWSQKRSALCWKGGRISTCPKQAVSNLHVLINVAS